MSAGDESIRAVGPTKRFGDVCAADDGSMDVPGGSRFPCLGPRGAGAGHAPGAPAAPQLS